MPTKEDGQRREDIEREIGKILTAFMVAGWEFGGINLRNRGGKWEKVPLSRVPDYLKWQEPHELDRLLQALKGINAQVLGAAELRRLSQEKGTM